MVLDHELLGGEGQVIRITQLSPGSWMLLGYQQDNEGSSTSTRENPTLDNTNWVNSPRSDASSHDTDYSNNGDEEYEEGLGNPKGHTVQSDICCRQRAHEKWEEPDKLRLLSYKDKMGMQWKEICERFPGRSPSAVKLRYWMLRKKDS
ncbi:hypothetical protein EJ07DRAFT_172627 [Lizonia empirigonia]|nr:hypothetical protein EJ07DRAFT_172627 [Lizonia empirigonia]